MKKPKLSQEEKELLLSYERGEWRSTTKNRASYTSQELKAIDRLVEVEKSKGRVVRAGKEFTKFIQKITKKGF